MENNNGAEHYYAAARIQNHIQIQRIERAIFSDDIADKTQGGKNSFDPLVKRGITAAAGAFLGIFLAVARLMMWQSPLLYSFGLERAAFEEMRVLVVSTLVGSPLGAAVAWIPKPKPRTTLAAVCVAVFLFSVMWLVPLLLPMGSAPRLCWEEMRVVIVGLVLGCIAGYTFGWAKKALP